MKVRSSEFITTLLLASGVLADQPLNKRTQQRFASLADVVHQREDPQGEREWLLGNTPMRAQPTPQERPEAFHGMHMDFTQTVAIFVSSAFTSSVVDTFMVVAP